MLKRCVPFVVTVMTLFFMQSVFANDWEDLIGSTPSIELDHNFNARQSPSQQQRLQVVKRLDQEILVLRAEMSKRNGDVRQVRQYLDQLEKQQILPPFIERVDALKQYVASQSGFFASLKRYMQRIDFPMQESNAVVAIVLPTSGSYELAGKTLQNALQKGLKEAGFKGKLVSLDSNLYASAFELWEILKYYQPDFIFGPLSKQKVVQWKELGTGVSTMYFNDIGYLGVGEFSLSPSRTAGLEQVFQLLQQAQYNNILVLRDNSEKSIELEEAFKQAWLSFNSLHDYNMEIIDGNVGQTIDDAMKVSTSDQRRQWLQKVLQEALEFESRPRQDIEAVISFVPQNLAIQISPYLNFLSSKKEVTHIWYPTQTPSAAFLDFNKDAWQQTFVILPQSIQIDTSVNRSQIDVNSKNGLFYALGQVAVEIVKNSALSTAVDNVEFTKYGSYVRNASGQFHLLPVVYWADNGVFERFYTLTE